MKKSNKRNVGYIVSLLSFAGWTISTGFMSFNYRDITALLKKRGEDNILPTVQCFL